MNKRDKRRLWARLKNILLGAFAGIGATLAAVAFILPRVGGSNTELSANKATENISKGFAAITGLIAGWLGGWYFPLYTLVYAMVFDYITGFMVGCAGKSKKTPNGRLSSTVGRDGVTRKAMILMVVGLGHLIDVGTGKGGSQVRDVICYLYLGNEGLSILENLGLLGVWIPPPIKKMLEIMRDKGILVKPSQAAEESTTDSTTKETGIG